MTSPGWQKQGRTWLHPTCIFFVVESEVPELVAGRSGALEYQVMRGGGDDSAGLPLVTFGSLDKAIEEAERRHRLQSQGPRGPD